MQWYLWKLNLYSATSSLMWPYFFPLLKSQIRQVLLYSSEIYRYLIQNKFVTLQRWRHLFPTQLGTDQWLEATCMKTLTVIYLFCPSNMAIQKFDPNASTWSSLHRPAGAINRLGQLSLYKLPGLVLCRKSSVIKRDVTSITQTGGDDKQAGPAVLV